MFILKSNNNTQTFFTVLCIAAFGHKDKDKDDGNNDDSEGRIVFSSVCL